MLLGGRVAMLRWVMLGDSIARRRQTAEGKTDGHPFAGRSSRRNDWARRLDQSHPKEMGCAVATPEGVES